MDQMSAREALRRSAQCSSRRLIETREKYVREVWKYYLALPPNLRHLVRQKLEWVRTSVESRVTREELTSINTDSESWKVFRQFKLLNEAIVRVLDDVGIM